MFLGLNTSHWIGVIAGILTTTAFLPQVVKILRTRDTNGISLTMYALSTVGVAIWIYYGFRINAPPIIIFNSINLVLILIILMAKLTWK